MHLGYLGAFKHTDKFLISGIRYEGCFTGAKERGGGRVRFITNTSIQKKKVLPAWPGH